MEALGINLPGLLAQIVNVGLLLFLLSRFAFKPIMSMLDQRAERIKDSLEAAERARQDVAASQANIQAQLDAARREGQVIIEQASRAAEQLRNETVDQARKEAEALLVRAQADFALEREKAMAELRRQFADLTMAAAERVVKQSLDASAHQRLIEEVLEQGGRNN
ncbi:MAG: ATP synthase F0 subunit B [Dehalococcoidia bacterium]|nr:ATP synthase F0 subunit B [Dehalococcoidia bacterium]